MSVSAISPVGSSLVPVYAQSPYLNGVTRTPDALAQAQTLSGDAGNAVQEYGAVALIAGTTVYSPVVISLSRPFVPAPSPVAGTAFKRIDTYA